MQYRLGDTEMGGVMLGDLYRAQLESLTLDLEQFQAGGTGGCNVRRWWWTRPAFRIIELRMTKGGPHHDAHHGCGLSAVHSRLQHRQGAA